MKQLWNSKKICAYFGWSYRYFIEVCRTDPTFPVHKAGGWKADPDDLERWFKSKPGARSLEHMHTSPTNIVPFKNNTSTARKRIHVPPPGGWQIKKPQYNLE